MTQVVLSYGVCLCGAVRHACDAEPVLTICSRLTTARPGACTATGVGLGIRRVTRVKAGA